MVNEKWNSAYNTVIAVSCTYNEGQCIWILIAIGAEEICRVLRTYEDE